MISSLESDNELHKLKENKYNDELTEAKSNIEKLSNENIKLTKENLELQKDNQKLKLNYHNLENNYFDISNKATEYETNYKIVLNKYHDNESDNKRLQGIIASDNDAIIVL